MLRMRNKKTIRAALMAGFSTETLGFLFHWATICAAIFGTIGVISALISAFSGYEVSGRLQKETDLKLAEANKNVAEARQETAEAKLETERVKEKVAWRRITKEQHDALISELRGKNFLVWTIWVDTDPEATLFHEEISATLREAGLDVRSASILKLAVGLELTNISGENHDLLVAAFEKAGIPLISIDPHRNFYPKELVLSVGSKPPPF